MDYIEKLKKAAYPQEYPKKQGSDDLVQIELVPLSLAIKMIEDIKSTSVQWSVGDFADRAKDMKGKKWGNFYDKKKFKPALKRMIHDHDCNHGITWETIDSYLDSDCKKTKHGKR